MMANIRTDHVETTDEMGSSVDIKRSELITVRNCLTVAIILHVKIGND